MKVLLLGAYGLIGTEVMLRLGASGHEVVGLGRDVTSARRRFPRKAFIAADLADLTTPAAWRPILEKVQPEAVVNAAGALQDGSRDRLSDVQSAAIRALVAAAPEHGVSRFVQISAVRAGIDAATAFMRTKGEADAALMTSGLDWTILRPGLVVGQQAYGGTALLRAIAAFPVVPPLAYADRTIQTVSNGDVADAVVRVLAGGATSRAVYDLVEETGQPLGEVVTQLRAWLGLPDARIVRAPGWCVKLVAGAADALGWLGWRSPFRSTALAELAAGVTGNPKPWHEASGKSLSTLTQTLAAMPATVQERWFARMFLLKPVVVATLSLFWIATGLITLADVDAAASILTRRGVGAGLAHVVAFGGSLADIVLGALVLVRATMSAAACGMIALTLVYIGGATLLAPDLWLDPLGPLVKTIPAMVLALVALALAEDR